MTEDTRKFCQVSARWLIDIYRERKRDARLNRATAPSLSQLKGGRQSQGRPLK